MGKISKLLNCCILRSKTSLALLLKKKTISERKRTKQFNNFTINFGFTIVELLVVMGVIGVLATFVFFNVKNSQDKGDDTRRKQDLQALATALVSYYTDNEAYPPPCSPSPCAGGYEISSDTADPWILGLDTYIQKQPKDPNQAGIIETLYALVNSRFNPTGIKNAPQATPAVAATGSVTLSPVLDGHMNNTTTCSETGTELFVEGSGIWRTFIKFNLTGSPGVPPGATITDVKLRYSVTVAQAANLSSLQAYNQDGQADPALDACNTTRRTRTANDPTPYVANAALTPSTGIRPDITIPAADVQAAFVSVGRFSLGINELSTNQTNARIQSTENAGTDEPKLIITYTTGGVPATTADITANGVGGSISVAYNASVTIAWTSNGTDCTITPALPSPPNPLSANGTAPAFNATTTTTYVLNCNGAGGPAPPDSVTVNVGAPPPATTADIYANGTGGSISVAYNASVTINWTSNGTSCTVSPDGWTGTNVTRPPFNATTTTTYVLNCNGSGGPGSDSVTVNVTAPPGCAAKKNVYCYITTADRLSFVLWAQLENPNDPERVGGPSAKCNLSTSPNPATFNLCIESPK